MTHPARPRPEAHDAATAPKPDRSDCQALPSAEPVADERTIARRRQLRQWDVDHLWHGFTQMQEYGDDDAPVIERGEGCWLIDVDGRRYLDGVASMWCNVHGHRRPEIDAAVREQLDRVAHSTLLGAANVPAIELARKLVERTAPLEVDGPRLSRVYFSDDGATAVEVALKMAYQYWQQRPDSQGGPRPEKTRFIALDSAYHGDTLGDVSVGGVAAFHAMFHPLLFPTWRAPQPHCYRCPLELDRASCHVDCATALERLLEAHHEQVAAVVIEPLVQGAAGMIVAPEGYLRAVRDATRKYDVLLIADEVAVGMGRTGRMFACEHEGVAPDFLCLAKGLTGGYLPLAATLTHDRIYEAFLGSATSGRTFYHGHTYGGNPLGAAAALATLDLFEQDQTLEYVRRRSEQLAGWLERIARRPHVGNVRQRGLLAGIELVRERQSRQPYPPEQRVGVRVCRHARQHGVWIRPLGDVIVIMPPLAISASELDLLCQTIDHSIQTITEAHPRGS